MRKVIAAVFTVALVASVAGAASACPWSSAPKDAKESVGV